MEQLTINRYFNNTASVEEQQQVINWLTDSSKRAEVLAWMEIYWQETKLEKMTPPLFEDILQKAKAREQNVHRIHSIQRKRQFSYIVAAACVGFLALGIWMGFFMKKDSNADNHQLIAAAATKKGERTQLMLHDGSEVFLNGDSKIYFEKDPVNKLQIIYLEGEAFFSQKTESTPLIIKTKDLVTTAKGAQFNISAFPSDSLVKVSVNKGNAEVKENAEAYFPMMKLLPAQKATELIAAKQTGERRTIPMTKLLPPMMVRAKEVLTFDKNKDNGGLALTELNDNASIWKDGILSFNNANKETIKNKLERWFGVSITFNVPQEQLPLFTKEFNKATLPEVLQVLANDLKVKYEYNGDIYIITKE